MSPLIWAAFTCCVLQTSFVHSASLANQELYEIPHPKFRLLKPRGFQFSIPDSPGVQLVAFHGNLNEKMRKMDVGQFSDDIVNKTNAKWIYQNKKLKVRSGDVIYYWMFVIKNGKGYTFDDGVYQISDSEIYETTKKTHKVHKRFASFHRPPRGLFLSHHGFGGHDEFFNHGRWYGHGHHHSHHGHPGHHPHDSFDSSNESNEAESDHHNCDHKHFGFGHGRDHKHWHKGHRGHHWSDEDTETTEASLEQTTMKDDGYTRQSPEGTELSTEITSDSVDVTTTIPSRGPLPISIPVYEEPMEDIGTTSTNKAITTTTTTDLPPIDIRFGQR